MRAAQFPCPRMILTYHVPCERPWSFLQRDMTALPPSTVHEHVSKSHGKYNQNRTRTTRTGRSDRHSLYFQRAASRTTRHRSSMDSYVRNYPQIGDVKFMYRYSCSHDQNQYVLKDVPGLIYDNFHQRVRPQLHQTRHLRLPVDHVPDQQILVYNYMTEDLLSLFKKRIPKETTKRILKASLEGIAALHEGDIVHLGIETTLIFPVYLLRLNLDRHQSR
jgi:hypothetical protein